MLLSGQQDSMQTGQAPAPAAGPPSCPLCPRTPIGPHGTQPWPCLPSSSGPGWGGLPLPSLTDPTVGRSSPTVVASSTDTLCAPPFPHVSGSCCEDHVLEPVSAPPHPRRQRTRSCHVTRLWPPAHNTEHICQITQHGPAPRKLLAPEPALFLSIFFPSRFAKKQFQTIQGAPGHVSPPQLQPTRAPADTLWREPTGAPGRLSRLQSYTESITQGLGSSLSQAP